MSGGKTLDEVKITLKSSNDQLFDLYVDIFDNSLSRKWLKALNHLLEHEYHLEKNFCWLGWANSDRNADYICEQINRSIAAINASGIGYRIDCEPYTVANTIQSGEIVTDPYCTIGDIVPERMNQLHRYFEDLQGWSGGISSYYHRADPVTRWHIRQLNLLCHEYETLVLSLRKVVQAPEWRRPSTLMCWLNAPRFALEPEDYELFGIETLNRDFGAVYVGVNKAVGKHHWEVFNDEGRDSRISELTTTGMRSQTEAAGDFDIEWGRNPGGFDWQQKNLADFRAWLRVNGFDPDDPELTIGHPQIGQVNLERSFGNRSIDQIWDMLGNCLDVYAVETSAARAVYDYHWSDADYMQQQIRKML